MKRSALLLVGLVLGMTTYAQSLANPESVEYDASQDRYLISNTSSGQILAQDQGGALTVFASLTGTGPHGLEIQGNVLYACNGGRVKGFDLSSGMEVFNLNLGGSFLNGITSDGNFLYVTDFSAQSIYRIDVAGQTFSVLTANTNGTPNGIVYDTMLDVLWVVFWGSNAPIKQIDRNSGAIVGTISTNLSNIDGVTIDCFGDLYVASWSPDQITRYPITITTGIPMPWSVSNPADIDYDQVNARICIPNTSTNSVSLETVSNCITNVEDVRETRDDIVYPNPVSRVLRFAEPMEATTPFQIFNSNGTVVFLGQLGTGAVNVEMLAPGSYNLLLGGERRAFRFTKD